jgi:F0F1-type ATP synthase assembly protein I
MKHHHKKEENLDYVYYLVGLLSGLFVGFIIDRGFTWIPVGGVLGLLTAAFFLNVLAKTSEDA